MLLLLFVGVGSTPAAPSGGRHAVRRGPVTYRWPDPPPTDTFDDDDDLFVVRLL